jgi:hypothetical protein
MYADDDESVFVGESTILSIDELTCSLSDEASPPVICWCMYLSRQLFPRFHEDEAAANAASYRFECIL